MRIEGRRVTVEQSFGDTVTAGHSRLLLLLLLLLMVMMWMMTVDVVAGVLLLPLSASVLEPDLHLGLAESQRQSQTQTLADRQIASQTELGLEGGELVVAECGSSASTSGPSTDDLVTAAVARRSAAADAVITRVRQHLPGLIKMHTCCIQKICYGYRDASYIRLI